MNHMEVSGLKQMTVRGIPAEVEREIKREARGKGKSLNKALISLLEKATGARGKSSSREFLHHDLDHLCGTWTREDAAEFGKNLKALRKIDGDLWERAF